MMMIQNPVLTGFNPDASILRVGEDYYIATSTFEWFPGVQLYHSRDLANWQLIPHALQNVSQLDLLGTPSSGGIWAPAISYDKGLYYLIYTDVKARKGVYKDLRNYLVTSESMAGPWSEPVFLNGSGFDPYLFHEDDGTKWLLNMQWDFRDGHNRFSGIVMQQYDQAQQKLVGPATIIYTGTDIGVTEGPQLFKRNGYYYLLVAEGGTGANHAATLARSKQLHGPYETDPEYPVLTTRGNPDYPLQNAGHGMLVETQAGDWYMCHICSRPFPGTKLNPLGRETSLQRVVWTEDNWLRLAHGGRLPALEAPLPDLPAHPFPALQTTDDFDSDTLGLQYQTLRVAAEQSWLSLSAAANRFIPGTGRAWWLGDCSTSAARSRRGWNTRRSISCRWPGLYSITMKWIITIYGLRMMRRRGSFWGFPAQSAASIAKTRKASSSQAAGRRTICGPLSTDARSSSMRRRTASSGPRQAAPWMSAPCPTNSAASWALPGR
jgi:xylan 1,4-beta-xylosidase